MLKLLLNLFMKRYSYYYQHEMMSYYQYKKLQNSKQSHYQNSMNLRHQMLLHNYFIHTLYIHQYFLIYQSHQTNVFLNLKLLKRNFWHSTQTVDSVRIYNFGHITFYFQIKTLLLNYIPFLYPEILMLRQVAVYNGVSKYPFLFVTIFSAVPSFNSNVLSVI